MTLNNKYLKILIWLVAIFGMIYTFLFSWFIIIEPREFRNITIEVRGKSIPVDSIGADTVLIEEYDTVFVKTICNN